QNLCIGRCDRIHQRSLARVGFDDEKLRQILERQRPLGTTKDLCWRVYDYLDCIEHCETAGLRDTFAKFVRSKCHFALGEMESALLCVSRYHSFMEVRCSTFLNEASRLKKELDPSVTPTPEICRFLHLNSLCLENSIAIYCANAKKIFRRLNFRDYFPSFTLPANDTLFDDLDLDSCQMYDFVKKNTRKTEDHYLDKELMTVINFFEAKNAVIGPATTSSTSVTTSKERKEFTKLLDELLDELPTTSGSESLDSSATTQTTATIRSFSYEETTVAYATTTTATSVATSVATTAATTAATTTVSTTAKPTTITTTRSTSTIASPNTTQPADKPNIKGEYNDYADVTVDVVPNERENSSISENFSTTTEPPKTSPRSRLFSDDSWEQTPPNFRYSSLRVLANGGVTPLNIDTTTLFGFDDDDEGEANDVSDDDEDKDDKAGVADSYEDSERNKGKDQVSTELKTTQPIGLLEVKLDSNRDDVVQQEDDIPTKHQSGEAREFVAQSTASTAEHNVKTTLIETVMESDNKSGNDLDKRLNLLRPSSTSPPVLPVPLTDGVKTKEQVWKEFNRNFGEE
ncbi:hypothetical protein Angca_000107, partial [Angiostrongylus cantonensis]